MRQFIKDSIQLSYANSRDPVIPNGIFTAVNDSIIHVAKDDAKYQADLSLATDFQAAGWDVRAHHVGTYTDYSGYNKKFVNDEGVFDQSAAMSEFARNSAQRGLLRPEHFTLLNRQTQADSHEAFIYNMLVSWLKARMYRDSRGDDDTFSVTTHPYRDSHYVIDLGQGLNPHQIDIEIGLPVTPDRIQDANWALRTKDNYWSRPYVLMYNGSSELQETFYLSHVLGRTEVSDLNFDFFIPPLPANQLLLQPFNGREFLPDNFQDIPWDQPETLWMWIFDYVKVNRVEQAFAAAFELLGSLAYQPQPSSAEASVWRECTLAPTLARFSPTRARFSTVLEGEPFKPYALADEFLVNESELPNQFLITSAMCNYYMWYGLYALLHNEARTRDDWRTVFTSNVDELQELYGPVMRAMCISVVTGREFSSCMNEGCALNVNFSRLSEIRELQKFRKVDEAAADRIMINAIYAPVSGSLVLGTMTADFEVSAHLSSNFTLHNVNQDILENNLSEMLKVATTYRLFGYDLELENMGNYQITQTWANVRECVPEPASIDFDPARPKTNRVIRELPRQGRRHILPNIVSMLNGSAAAVTVQRPTIKITQWQRRQDPLRPNIVFKRKKTEVRFKVNAPLKYDNVLLRGKPSSIRAQPGFRNEQTAVPPVGPEAVEVVTRAAPEVQLGAEEPTPADFVE
ncbi:capsid protein [Syncephalastrum racemosum totivirus 1]|nr:capsid protein [Syncephalastrum racemosum totivirus 1]